MRLVDTHGMPAASTTVVCCAALARHRAATQAHNMLVLHCCVLS
jgi:hypothetical protein